MTADLSGVLHVLDGRNGHDLPGWPQPVQVTAGQTVAVESSPTVADLDHNGHKEIIVGAGTVDIGGQQGGVVAFNANGSVRWRIQTMTVAGESGVRGHAGGRRRERRRLPRRRVRQLRPSHLRGQPVRPRAARLPDGQRSTPSGTRPRSTTRGTSGAWTSSSAATRARAVRAASRTWSGIMRAIRVTAFGSAGPVVALPAPDLPVEPGDRQHRRQRPHGRSWSEPEPGRRGMRSRRTRLNAFHLDNGADGRGLARGAQRPDLRLAGDRRRERRSNERRGGDRVRDVQRRSGVGIHRSRRRALERRRRGGNAHRDPRRRRSSSTSTATASTTSPSVRPARSTSCAAATARRSTSRSK